MPSLFFYRIGRLLEKHGCRVTRINFCLGDRLFWPDRRAIAYRGRYRYWPDFIRRFLVSESVSDIVLLGEQRKYHKEAVSVAQELGIRVTVTDFGYLRPDWITWERNGMSGNSLFPRDPEVILSQASSIAEPDWRPQFQDSGFLMARNDLLYNIANILDFPFNTHYRRSDERPPTAIYTLASAKRLFENRIRKKRYTDLSKELIQKGIQYYLFPLQLDFDYQIIAYSSFKNMGEALRLVMHSFARNAPPDSHLVIKEHPWDPAIKNWQRFTRKEAKRIGISNRILYLRGGNLDQLIAAARGVVVINSSTGIRSLQIGTPLKALGQAIFDIPGLTYSASLNSFWQTPKRSDPDLVKAFLRLLATTIQIRGVFFREPGLGHAVNQAVDRLLAD
jgi:capsular polysaccharide export protein